MKKKTLLIVALMVILGGVVHAQTILFVSPAGNNNNSGASWNSAKKTLAGALTAVNGITHIYMRVGNYTCSNVVIPYGVTVTGGYASSSTGTDTTHRLYPGTNSNWDNPSLCTILKGNNTSRVATVNAGGKLEGCVVTQGRVSGNGGGVLIDGGTVQHCAIIRNMTSGPNKGGGAYIQNNGLLLNCVIAYNSANNGPGVAGTAGTLTNNTITANTAIVYPIVTTNNVSNITASTATCGGQVSYDGGSEVASRGVCWSITQNPTINDNITTNGSGTGNFNCNITGLSPYTTYHVRAYATNAVGTAYGNDISFTTANIDGQSCPNAAVVYDYDGNSYNTVQIGNQCWMKQNMRTTHYTNGVSIALGGSSSSSETTPYRYYPDNSSSNVSSYGYLYNWPAVMHGANFSSSNPSSVQGICPTGWHVPSAAEWVQLTNYVSSVSAYTCGGNTNSIAKALASTTGWRSVTSACFVGNMTNNNATGFGAMPAGYAFASFSYYAYFWSTTEYNSSSMVTIRFLRNTSATVGTDSGLKSSGFSVRCLRD